MERIFNLKIPFRNPLQIITAEWKGSVEGVCHLTVPFHLPSDPRVVSTENMDIREFKLPSDEHVDWVVADISFNSLTRVVEAIKILAPTASLLLLIKPQFEFPRELVPSGGIITGNEDRESAIKGVCEALEAIDFQVRGTFDARVTGRSGNREAFVLAKRNT